MLDEKNVYAQDSGKNNFLTMTREQILTAITQAVNEGTIGDIDAGFVTKIQEMNNQGVVKLWVGTSSEFTAIAAKDENTLYLLTDDTTVDDIEQAFKNIEEGISPVGNAQKINGIELKYDENGVLKIGDIIIPQKKLLSDTVQEIGTSGKTIYSSDGSILGKSFEINIMPTGSNNACVESAKIRFDDDLSVCNVVFYDSEMKIISFGVTRRPDGVSNAISATVTRYDAPDGTIALTTVYVKDIYEIIE